MKFDMHIHTSVSPCSRLTMEEILAEAGSKGLDGVCITDHNTMAGLHQLTEGLQENGLCVIFGLEYETSDGDFLLFGPFEDIPAGLAARELLLLVEESGGVAVAAHPFRSSRPVKELLIQQGLCRIVEGINGRNSDSENRKVATWENRYSIKQVGGSDAHSLQELGRVVTRFHSPIHSRSDLVRALINDKYSPEENSTSSSVDIDADVQICDRFSRQKVHFR